MPLSFPLTINLDFLQECHIQAATTLAEAPLDADIENYRLDIEISGIETEEQLKAFKQTLIGKLSKYNLTDHQDHFIYFYYLFQNFDAPEFLYNEMLYKHASENVKRLIDLVKLKTQTEETDISITIEDNSTSVTFNTEFIISHVWENLYNSLIFISTVGARNHILRDQLEGLELTVDNLKKVSKQLKVRHNRFWNQSIAHFGKTVLYYLNLKHIAKGETLMSTKQAMIIFDIMESFSLINSDKIGSWEDDYIKALFKNNKLL